METFIIKGQYLITDVTLKESGILTDGAVYVAEGKVVEIGDYHSLQKKYPEAMGIGDGKQLLMPGLVDAHSHGSGLSPFQQGIPYDFLENNFFDWSFGILPDPELCAMVSAVRHLRNGCTTVHCNAPGTIDRTEKLIDGFQKTGIRLAFSLSGTDMNNLALDNTAFLKTLPHDLQEFATPIVYNDQKAIREEYFHTFEHLYSKYHSERTRIIFGPALATRCSDEFLQQIKTRADELGKLQIHIHTLQTPVQKAYALKKYGKSQIAHFEDIGLLDQNLTLGHAVFLTAADIELLGSHRVSTTHHPNCNFLIRNGISPVYYLLKAGVNVALGIDDKGFNDDEDAFMELRLIHRLHRVAGFELSSTSILDAFDVLKIGTTNAARACLYDGEIGGITPGMKADLILVDLQDMLNDPWISPEMNIAEVVIHRAKGAHVNTVFVDGNMIMKDRKFLHLDVKHFYGELGKQMSKGLSAEQKKYADTLQQIKPYCQQWYKDWLNNIEWEPFYRLNSQI